MTTYINLLALAERLNTTRNALYLRILRNPYSVPPHVTFPNAKERYMFDVETVEEWMRDPLAFTPASLHPKKPVGRPRKFPLPSTPACTSGKRRGRPPKAAQPAMEVQQ